MELGAPSKLLWGERGAGQSGSTNDSFKPQRQVVWWDRRPSSGATQLRPSPPQTSARCSLTHDAANPSRPLTPNLCALACFLKRNKIIGRVYWPRLTATTWNIYLNYMNVKKWMKWVFSKLSARPFTRTEFDSWFAVLFKFISSVSTESPLTIAATSSEIFIYPINIQPCLNFSMSNRNLTYIELQYFTYLLFNLLLLEI